MKGCYFTVFLILAAASFARAQAPDDFAACAAKMGEEYVKARDDLLAGPTDDAFLKQKLKSASWQDRLAARILLGWQKQEKRYRELLAERKIKDQKGTSYFPWSVEPNRLGASDMPLMLELLTKQTDPDAVWDAARVLLVMTRNDPSTPLDVHSLEQFLQEQSPAADASRKAVAWLIGALPAKYQESTGLRHSLKKELARKDKSREVVQSLLEGLGRAADQMSPQERDATASDLLAMADLQEFVGKGTVTYAVAGIGGDKASQLVKDYLDQTPDDQEKLWAIRALSKSESTVGTRAILQYAESGPAPLRREAIQSLAQSRYTPEVGVKLAAVALNTNAPESQQLAAVYSLAKISAKHPKDENLQKDIQSQMEKISASKPTSAALQRELNSYLQEMKQNRP